MTFIVKPTSAYLVESAAEDDDESEGRECLTQLYTGPADLWRSGDRLTISQVIMEAMRADAQKADW